MTKVKTQLKKASADDRSTWDADDLAGFTTPDQRALKRKLSNKVKVTRPNQFK